METGGRGSGGSLAFVLWIGISLSSSRPFRPLRLRIPDPPFVAVYFILIPASVPRHAVVCSDGPAAGRELDGTTTYYTAVICTEGTRKS